MPDSEHAPKPKTQYGDIPAELSFEEVIKNRTAPPCSLNDFVDYLFYVEHNAETLQFFLWYWDYIQRWSSLLPRQKALSPPWDPEQATEPRSRFIKYSHKRERSLKMNKVLAIMEMDSERASLDPSPQDDTGSSPVITSPIASPTAILSPTGSIKPSDWQPFTIQPNRTELSRITRHYICPSAPRHLRLSQKDRAACLRAVQHTTHPSALLPAFLTSEATLRAHSHPAFIRWARRNANPSRVLFLRILGCLLLLLGVAVDVILILSGLSAYWRVALQVFGPANEYAGEAWMAGYESKGLVGRVFDETVVVQNQALATWQDRAVFFALLWGGAGSAALTVVSLFVPSGSLF
ncbi:hypothetical protein C8A01DRAFT_12949 [Parachaetomium inaequale]|uniref:RGS domain-containing protein n=1 Tax=Parachaetomium inaequale TaxID=2588326 RepID=A0AAN6PNZ2_9PEZI|nr:hypothetical protein C8A01DRAFT_12949 [Parachaetomium inaequale]